jgi:hypothetical protein
VLPFTSIAVIPEEYYRKPKGVQFKKSFRSRADAVRYAEGRGYRLVIACEAAGCYDVMCDPDPVIGPRGRFQLVQDRGEFVAVPLSLTINRPKRIPGPPPAPPKKSWASAARWLVGAHR